MSKKDFDLATKLLQPTDSKVAEATKRISSQSEPTFNAIDINTNEQSTTWTTDHSVISLNELLSRFSAQSGSILSKNVFSSCAPNLIQPLSGLHASQVDSIQSPPSTASKPLSTLLSNFNAQLAHNTIIDDASPIKIQIPPIEVNSIQSPPSTTSKPLSTLLSTFNAQLAHNVIIDNAPTVKIQIPPIEVNSIQSPPSTASKPLSTLLSTFHAQLAHNVIIDNAPPIKIKIPPAEQLLRRERNKIHARQTRERKKEYLRSSEKRVEELKEQQFNLKQVISEQITTNFLIGVSANTKQDKSVIDPKVDKLLRREKKDIGNDYKKFLSYTDIINKVNIDANFLHYTDYNTGFRSLSPKHRSYSTKAELIEIRRERNRIHARRTRDRKKMIIMQTQAMVKTLEQENALLTDHLKHISNFVGAADSSDNPFLKCATPPSKGTYLTKSKRVNVGYKFTENDKKYYNVDKLDILSTTSCDTSLEQHCSNRSKQGESVQGLLTWYKKLNTAKNTEISPPSFEDTTVSNSTLTSGIGEDAASAISHDSLRYHKRQCLEKSYRNDLCVPSSIQIIDLTSI